MAHIYEPSRNKLFGRLKLSRLTPIWNILGTLKDKTHYFDSEFKSRIVKLVHQIGYHPGQFDKWVIPYDSYDMTEYDLLYRYCMKVSKSIKNML